jgi:hypothetical protein
MRNKEPERLSGIVWKHSDESTQVKVPRGKAYCDKTGH